MKNLEIRYQKALNEIGGSIELFKLPKQIKEVLKNTTDFETKVKMFEEIAKEKKLQASGRNDRVGTK